MTAKILLGLWALSRCAIGRADDMRNSTFDGPRQVAVLAFLSLSGVGRKWLPYQTSPGGDLSDNFSSLSDFTQRVEGSTQRVEGSTQRVEGSTQRVEGSTQ